MFGHNLFTPSDASNLLVDSNTFLGVELEFNRVDFRMPEGYWQPVGDGSLHDRGMEFRLTAPLQGAELVNALQQLPKDTTKYVDVETSMHVHANVMLSDPYGVANTLILLTALEDVLFTEQYRKASAFCCAVSETPAWRDTVFDVIRRLYNFDIENVIQQVNRLNRREQRYFSFTIDSIARFGSIEIRTFQAPKNFEDALRKVNIVLAFLNLENQMPHTTMQDAVNFAINIAPDALRAMNIEHNVTAADAAHALRGLV